eukprot:jgi/Chlat1/6261/Chrsp44S05775
MAAGGGGGGTRLDRLLTLLDTGTSPVTRRTAALQIGDIAKQHRQQLPILLRRVQGYLRSKNWDTRTAAACAIGSIAEAVSHVLAEELLQRATTTEVVDIKAEIKAEDETPTGKLSFARQGIRCFDIQQVLRHAARLVASGGQEYDVLADPSLTPQQRLERQAINLRKRLGLDGVEQFMDMTEVISYEDLVQRPSGSPGRLQCQQSSQAIGAAELMAEMEKAATLSAREKNVLKRKAKALARTGSQLHASPSLSIDADADRTGEDATSAERPLKRERSMRSMMTPQPQSSDKLVIEAAIDTAAEAALDAAASGRWVFTSLCEDLLHDIFHPNWEVRHGAGMALREVLRYQGHVAGINVQAKPVVESQIPDLNTNAKADATNEPAHKEAHEGPAAAEAIAANSAWLEDCAVRLLCVFALDRFCDFVSDQVVAPVRETCAQALGAAFKYMPLALLSYTLSTLLQLQARPEWEVRHGGLLGIKYLVAVRQELLPVLLPGLLPSVTAGLDDMDDDVRAVAADALAPAANAIVTTMPPPVLKRILHTLWNALLELDDLSPSTSSIMTLLAELYTQPVAVNQPTTSTPKQSHGLAASDSNAQEMQQLVAKSELHDSSIKSELGTNYFDLEEDLSLLVPRLWPFLRHNIISVRLGSMRTLERLLSSGGLAGQGNVWAVPILEQLLRYTYQNCLVEQHWDVLSCTHRVWRLLCESYPAAVVSAAARPWVQGWLSLASTPSGSTLDTSLFMFPVSMPRSRVGKRPVYKPEANGSKGEAKIQVPMTEPTWSGHALASSAIRHAGERYVVGTADGLQAVDMRMSSSTVLGALLRMWPPEELQDFLLPVAELLKTGASSRRLLAGLVVAEWLCPAEGPATLQMPEPASNLRSQMLDLLKHTDSSCPSPNSREPYVESRALYIKLRGEAARLVQHAQAAGLLTQVNKLPDTDSIGVDAASQLAQSIALPLGKAADAGSAHALLSQCRSSVLGTAGYLHQLQINLHMSVLASLASAVVATRDLPVKLNPVVQPLMSGLRREQAEPLQRLAARSVALLAKLSIERRPSPNDKIVKNVCALACADPAVTPPLTTGNMDNESIAAQELELQESAASARVGRKDLLEAELTAAKAAMDAEAIARAEGAVTRRGAEATLQAFALQFGDSLFTAVPKLWDCMAAPFQGLLCDNPSLPQPSMHPMPNAVLVASFLQAHSQPNAAQTIVESLQVVQILVPSLHKSLQEQLLRLLPAVFVCLGHPHALVRRAAARCIAAFATTAFDQVIRLVLQHVVPMLGDTTSASTRRGAAAAFAAIVAAVGHQAVPYAALLVVPLLGRMSDSEQKVRESVTHTFATLVPLLPLARGMSLPEGLQETHSADLQFLEQLLDNNQVDDYVLPVRLNCTLRRYQQEGINWLAFLRRFRLHGILCDDMGLGKTLQASAIMAADIADRAARHAETQRPDSKPLPSLVVCPPTLVAHWELELQKFCGDVIKPLQYVGPLAERVSLRKRFKHYNVVVTSYEVLRNDIDVLFDMAWSYCVLDEGHIIKNSKAKITQAVKRVRAEHRLILSGTPVQNHVLELWSLFDFLMPGFLGTEQQFNQKFGRAVTAARDPKSTQRDTEASILAMDALHKQVMPFLLRRTKDQVLADLPPKIIQDIYCDLSPLQLRLYEHFSRSQARSQLGTDIEHLADSEDAPLLEAAPGHVFQALQYLRKLCSHPSLVVDTAIPQHTAAVQAEGGLEAMHKLHNAPKLLALQELLHNCGIGLPVSAEASLPGGEAQLDGGQHRVLIFAQLKAFLDIIENDLFQKQMPQVTYLRLDGSIAASKRFDIVQRFNTDPTIDVLLLSTHVGGLGLNLTAADTVIFVEHDWNPMRDLQAMDRAHRLGQQRSVNVYRLITRGTVEEKVMSLQRFKLSIANAVVNKDNLSMDTMDTTQLLDLFTVSQPGSSTATAPPAHKKSATGLKAMLSGLGELWEESQYAEEYDLGKFVGKLGK